MTTTTGPGPAFATLTQARCEELLAAHTVGRVGITAPDGPLILPVNYQWRGGTVVFRTAPYGPLAGLARRTPVAFEIDGIDEETKRGWSVLVRGSASAVTSNLTLSNLWKSGPEPWAEGSRTLFISVDCWSITGRDVRGPYAS